LHPDGQDDEWKAFESLQSAMAGHIYKLTNNVRDRHFYRSLHNLYPAFGLEASSYEFIKMGYHLMKYLQGEYKLHPVFKSQDYSPGMICFAKAFENEVNLSIVQWIRKLSGIRLPECYCKFDAAKGDLLLAAGKKQVNVNREDRGQWLAPGLGESEWLARSLKPPAQFDESNWKDFCGLWKNMIPLRNRTAHPEPVDFETGVKMIKLLESVAKKHYFSNMITLKSLLQSTD
jgi:hypothetical protein